MTRKDLHCIYDIFIEFTKAHSLTSARQNMANELRRMGDLTYAQIINLREYYNKGSWDNVYATRDLSLQDIETDHKYYIHVNPVVPLQPTLREGRSVFRHSELIGIQKWSESEFTRDFLRRYEMQDGVNMLLFDRAGNLAWGFGSGHHRIKGVKPRFVDVLRRFSQHFSNALENAERWQGLLNNEVLMDQILSKVNDALAIVRPATSVSAATLIEATDRAKDALGLADSDTTKNLYLRSFLNTCSYAVGKSVEWFDSKGRKCLLSAIRISPWSSDSSALLVRIEPKSATAYMPLNLTAPATYISAREKQILALAALGRSDKETARELSLSVHTVRAHLRNVYSKLKVSGKIEALNALGMLTP